MSFPGRALLIGDLMLDRYLEGQIHRISPEGPVPVLSLEREWATPGGAGNVAASLVGLGCQVTLVGVMGSDEEGNRLRLVLEEAGVSATSLVECDDLRTICKTRVVAAGTRQQVLRLDQDGDPAAYYRASTSISDRIVSMIAAHDVVVLSDYDKGTISDSLARRVTAECRVRHIPCVVDPKKADFSSYSGATLLTPNVSEASRALRRTLSDDTALLKAVVEAREALGLDHLLITRGPQGMTLASIDGISHFQAEVRDVADVTGAGDTVTATLAACLASGRDMKEACRLASIAAGIAVGHRGCHVVKASELEAAFRGRSPKIKDRLSLRRWVDDQRRRGHRIVFTNGCFDILHAGHLTCLEQARRLGDVLIIGLNSDASVRLNKGPSRPVIGEEHRASLLAGLECVDTVVLFDELTPEMLIRELSPDVLVKGGDYADKTIAGAEFVKGNGGEVVMLPLVEGLSTTAILTSARRNSR